MKIVLMLLLLIGLAGCANRPLVPLFVIEEHGRFGFIDSTGKLMIPLQFANAGSINPAQFWRKDGYIPQNIREPVWLNYD